MSDQRTEPEVQWPKLDKPVFITRDFLLCIQTNGKACEPKRITNASLEVLVNGCLYLVTEDGYGLRRGQVLSRNLKLTKRIGGSCDDPATHCFIRYDGVNDARRSLGRLDGTYRQVEIPKIAEWRERLEWMLRASWTLKEQSDAENFFVWEAGQLVAKHAGVIDESKRSAQARTRKAGLRRDRTDRRNTGMIPLLCFAADASLYRRMQAVRGIGRRIEWRAVVLESYIDQLRAKCCEVERGVQYHLSESSIFGENRIPNKIRECATRMREYVATLRRIHARPFSRSLTHAAADLELAATHMIRGADTRDVVSMEQAAAFFRRVYRSMRMLELHWRLEEVLVVVAQAHHRNRLLTPTELDMCGSELSDIHQAFTSKDSFTNEPFEHGFQTRVLPHVVAHIHLAHNALLQTTLHDGVVHLGDVYDNLKEACSPF